ncbi:hypothetical protein BJ742DRAFT_782296 [Cladochytrium replicatum]|nr:hypothetical protein BJ742DRAFT_782296 [Cladochytrium replicatum]
MNNNRNSQWCNPDHQSTTRSSAFTNLKARQALPAQNTSTQLQVNANDPDESEDFVYDDLGDAELQAFEVATASYSTPATFNPKVNSTVPQIGNKSMVASAFRPIPLPSAAYPSPSTSKGTVSNSTSAVKNAPTFEELNRELEELRQRANELHAEKSRKEGEIANIRLMLNKTQRENAEHLANQIQQVREAERQRDEEIEKWKRKVENLETSLSFKDHELETYREVMQSQKPNNKRPAQSPSVGRSTDFPTRASFGGGTIVTTPTKRRKVDQFNSTQQQRFSPSPVRAASRSPALSQPSSQEQKQLDLPSSPAHPIQQDFLPSIIPKSRSTRRIDLVVLRSLAPIISSIWTADLSAERLQIGASDDRLIQPKEISALISKIQKLCSAALVNECISLKPLIQGVMDCLSICCSTLYTSHLPVLLTILAKLVQVEKQHRETYCKHPKALSIVFDILNALSAAVSAGKVEQAGSGSAQSATLTKKCAQSVDSIAGPLATSDVDHVFALSTAFVRGCGELNMVPERDAFAKYLRGDSFPLLLHPDQKPSLILSCLNWCLCLSSDKEFWQSFCGVYVPSQFLEAISGLLSDLNNRRPAKLPESRPLAIKAFALLQMMAELGPGIVKQIRSHKVFCTVVLCLKTEALRVTHYHASKSKDLFLILWSAARLLQRLTAKVGNVASSPNTIHPEIRILLMGALSRVAAVYTDGEALGLSQEDSERLTDCAREILLWLAPNDCKAFDDVWVPTLEPSQRTPT